MHSWLTLNVLLAEEAVPAVQDPSPWGMMMPMVLIGAFFYFIVLRPQASEKKKHQNVLDALKKNDRVVTTGGIIGSVANISNDGKEITLKVDDNTRIKFRRSSIGSVLTDEKDDAAKS